MEGIYVGRDLLEKDMLIIHGRIYVVAKCIECTPMRIRTWLRSSQPSSYSIIEYMLSGSPDSVHPSLHDP